MSEEHKVIWSCIQQALLIDLLVAFLTPRLLVKYNAILQSTALFENSELGHYVKKNRTKSSIIYMHNRNENSVGSVPFPLYKSLFTSSSVYFDGLQFEYYTLSKGMAKYECDSGPKCQYERDGTDHVEDRVRVIGHLSHPIARCHRTGTGSA